MCAIMENYVLIGQTVAEIMAVVSVGFAKFLLRVETYRYGDGVSQWGPWAKPCTESGGRSCPEAEAF